MVFLCSERFGRSGAERSRNHLHTLLGESRAGILTIGSLSVLSPLHDKMAFSLMPDDAIVGGRIGQSHIFRLLVVARRKCLEDISP